MPKNTKRKRQAVRLWQAHKNERSLHPDQCFVEDRRRPENAPIRRWLAMGQKALEPTFSDEDLISAA